MKWNSRSLGSFLPAVCLSVLFILYTMLIRNIDVKPIGPNGSAVGFATVNGWAHDLLGVNWTLYIITDWLGLVPVFVAFGFAALGLTQLIRRKSLLRVDGSILVLGGFYVLVMGAYLFFEYYRVNYRPVLIDGILETSYPSSTTMLVLCVMLTAMMQFRRLTCNRTVKNAVNTVLAAFTAFMVIGRLVSGVHWLTDILGGALLSAALVLLYRGANAFIAESQHEAKAAGSPTN
ncbi:phosphatase PAP2 family protein [Caproiciproducens sp. NJN-50]|uniref:phosphatase PAP2 family protein n=1 Tax=Acutalibacteraceae TaxID=3082771 RepID=UPI000FFE1AF2|nr:MULTISPECIES: phosphatase PAP2 family protein [Acutalibacteraceae]QAT50434.1 phosphatase PAP2 family protein [Caproiciproducens sp. NJN-50]